MRSIFQNKPKGKVWLIRLFLFLFFLLIIEAWFRLRGHSPGVASNDFVPTENFKYVPYYYSDSLGINHLLPTKSYDPIHKRNSEGFRNPFDFDSQTLDSLREGKKLIFLVGDSYTEGCCPESYSNSFADLLRNNKDWLILNFGVGATDPLQYRLIVQHYGPIIQPDLIVICYFLGNDILDYRRSPKPFIPISYPVHGVASITSEIPPHLVGRYDSAYPSAQAAYQDFVDHYSLLGEERSFLANLASKTVIFSRLWIGIEITSLKRKLKQNLKSNPVQSNMPYEALKIDSLGEELGIPILHTAIPNPADIKTGNFSTEQYLNSFQGVAIHFAPFKDYEPWDFDGMKVSNHFVASGHKKFAAFLEEKIRSIFKAQSSNQE